MGPLQDKKNASKIIHPIQNKAYLRNQQKVASKADRATELPEQA